MRYGWWIVNAVTLKRLEPIAEEILSLAKDTTEAFDDEGGEEMRVVD